MEDIHQWPASSKHKKWPSIRIPHWLIHTLDYGEIFVGWPLGKLCDLAFEALREQIVPRLMRWWKTSRKGQPHGGIVRHISPAGELNLAGNMIPRVTRAPTANSQ